MGIIAVVAVLLVYLAVGLALRRLANQRDKEGRPDPTFAVIIPGNMHALVTKQRNEVADTSLGGGSVVGIVHAIPGMRLDKSSSDIREWHYVKGREWRGLFYRMFDVQIIGFLRYLRLNSVRTFRFSRKEGERDYEIKPKDAETRFVHFQGQHDMLFRNVETAGIFRVDLPINILYDELYPVRVQLLTADAFAELTLMVERVVVAVVGRNQPEDLIRRQDVQDGLSKAIADGVRDYVLNELGMGMRLVTFGGIDYDKESREILEAEQKAERLGAAKIAEQKAAGEAEHQRALGLEQAQNALTRADMVRAELFERLARNEAATALFTNDRRSRAYETNTTVTVYAPGAEPVLPLPVPTSK